MSIQSYLTRLMAEAESEQIKNWAVARASTMPGPAGQSVKDGLRLVNNLIDISYYYISNQQEG